MKILEPLASRALARDGPIDEDQIVHRRTEDAGIRITIPKVDSC
jgi:hypothetical protein